MSIYSNVTEQVLIVLRNLADQQKEQRAIKIKNRILKQTHDGKLAESLSPITKKLEEVSIDAQESLIPNNTKLDTLNKSTEEVGEIIKETNMPQLDILLENTFSNMKINKSFFNIEEKDNGDIFWNGFPVEKMGGNKLKINGKIHEIPQSVQKVLTDTSNIPIKQLNDKDRDSFTNNSESLNFENYKAIRGESKSFRYKQSKSNLKK